MPLMRKIMETVVQFAPAKEPDPLIHKHGCIGREIDR
jgi:xanthine dehydrogenase YagR molybdenum-binding subunit